jgi:cysteine desulfurase
MVKPTWSCAPGVKEQTEDNEARITRGEAIVAMKIGEAIYLDHMASTPVDQQVLAAMEPYYRMGFANPHSVNHAFGWAANEAIDRAAITVARFIGADPDEIIFTSGATEANNLAILGLAARAPDPRRRILVSAIEHKCVLAAAHAAALRFNMRVELTPVDAQGVIDLETLERRLNDDVLCVAVMAVNNEVGTIQPIAAIGALCEKWGAIFHTDAAQAPVATQLDVYSHKIGTLSLSAHKIYGPKGIGAAFLRRDLQERIEPLIYGGGQQRNLRSGTLATPLCVGFGKAVELLAHSNWTEGVTRLAQLRDQLECGLSASGLSITVNGQGAQRHPGCSNLCFIGSQAEDILAAVQPSLAASTGSACTSGTIEPSHVLRAMGLSDEDAAASVRFSIGRYTAASDIDVAVELLHKAVIDQTAAAA